MFITDYERGWPVVVYGPNKKPIGIPCGFLIFEDGVSWADDAVLQDVTTTHAYHHLFGDVQIGKDVLCRGFRFASAPAWDPDIGSAWTEISRLVFNWTEVHDCHERELKRERAAFGRSS